MNRVRQGCPSSPYLFNFFIDSVLNIINVNTFQSMVIKFTKSIVDVIALRAETAKNFNHMLR